MTVVTLIIHPMLGNGFLGLLVLQFMQIKPKMTYELSSG
jgi:hypothetical protein